jgi:hypothetical protein
MLRIFLSGPPNRRKQPERYTIGYLISVELWIDMDISKYTNSRSDDTIPHEKFREILGQRVSNGIYESGECEIP